MRSAVVGILGLALTLGCSSDPEERLDIREDQIAIAGPWGMPADVHAAGQMQWVRRDLAAVWSGGSCSGCCTASSCGGGDLPGTKAFKSFLLKTFAGEISSIGGYCCRPNTGDTKYTSIHGTGRALDVMIPKAGSDADNTKGDKVANWLVLHATEIGVQLVIWDRMTWNPSRTGEKFNPYTGPIPHIDHLHVELNLDGANMKTPFFTSGAAGGTPCMPKCDGNVIVSADCSRGDCAAYGARCVADPAPRCVFGECPATGAGSTCIDGKTIANCVDGKITTTGDCSAYAAACTSVGLPAGQARCLSVFCTDETTKLPVARDTCWFEKGQRMTCDAGGNLTVTPCPAGEACSVIGGTHCEPARCPASGESLICVDGKWLSRCVGGSIVSASDCGAGSCANDGGAHCLKAPSGDDPDDPAPTDEDAGPTSDTGTDAGTDAATDTAITPASGATPEDGNGELTGSCSTHPGRAPLTGASAILATLALAAARRRRR